MIQAGYGKHCGPPAFMETVSGSSGIRVDRNNFQA